MIISIAAWLLFSIIACQPVNTTDHEVISTFYEVREYAYYGPEKS